MKPVIFFDTTKEKILRQLPKSLRSLVEEVELVDNDFLLLLFSQDRRKVVDEGDAKKAVEISLKISTSQKIILADSLTQEANNYFQANDFVVIARDTNFWNDDSLHRIKQGKY